MRKAKEESKVTDRTTENGKENIDTRIHGPTPVEGFPHEDPIFVLFGKARVVGPGPKSRGCDLRWVRRGLRSLGNADRVVGCAQLPVRSA